MSSDPIHAMIPDNENRRLQLLKELWRATYASSSVYEAIYHAEALLKLDREQDGLAWQAHWIAFVVAYSRPFTPNHGLGKEKSRIPAEFRELHHEIYETHRNRCIAHTDPTEEDLNELVFTVGNGSLRADPIRHHPSRELIIRCHEMAIAVSDALADRIAECLIRFPELADFQPGSYRLLLGRASGNEWKRLP